MIKREYWDMKKLKQMKADYKKEMERTDKLPADYQTIFEKVSDNMMAFYGGFDGFDVWDAQYQLLDMLEEAAADGVAANDFVGGDLDKFSAEFRKEVELPTWENNIDQKKKAKMNKRINKKLGGDQK